MPCPKRKAAALPSHRGWIQPSRSKITAAALNVTGSTAGSLWGDHKAHQRGDWCSTSVAVMEINTPLTLQDLPIPQVVLSSDARIPYNTEMRMSPSRQMSLGKKPIQSLCTKEKLNKPVLLCPASGHR